MTLGARTGKATAIHGLTDRNVTVAPGTEVLDWRRSEVYVVHACSR